MDDDNFEDFDFKPQTTRALRPIARQAPTVDEAPIESAPSELPSTQYSLVMRRPKTLVIPTLDLEDLCALSSLGSTVSSSGDTGPQDEVHVDSLEISL